MCRKTLPLGRGPRSSSQGINAQFESGVKCDPSLEELTVSKRSLPQRFVCWEHDFKVPALYQVATVVRERVRASVDLKALLGQQRHPPKQVQTHLAKQMQQVDGYPILSDQTFVVQVEVHNAHKHGFSGCGHAAETSSHMHGVN